MVKKYKKIIPSIILILLAIYILGFKFIVVACVAIIGIVLIISALTEKNNFRFCTNCGQKLNKGNKFCTNCGERIKEKNSKNSNQIRRQRWSDHKYKVINFIMTLIIIASIALMVCFAPFGFLFPALATQQLVQVVTIFFSTILILYLLKRYE